MIGCQPARCPARKAKAGGVFRTSRSAFGCLFSVARIGPERVRNVQPPNRLAHLRGGCVALNFAHPDTTKCVWLWICASCSRVRCSAGWAAIPNSSTLWSLCSLLLEHAFETRFPTMSPRQTCYGGACFEYRQSVFSYIDVAESDTEPCEQESCQL
jgi:hypothetical protein